MRAVVLGGAGFIGSYLIDSLLARGHSVVCIDNLASGSLDNLSRHTSNGAMAFAQRDITRPLQVAGRVDYVLHLASLASPVDYSRYPIETLAVGSLGTFNSLELARRKGARYLFTSTSEVYGNPQLNPQPESYWGNVNPVGPRAPYDESKRFAEALVMAYHRRYGLDVRIARVFNTYGPRMRQDDGRVVPAFISQALGGRPLTVFGDGSQTRSLCYVSDTIAAIEGLMATSFPEPVNIGNPNEVSILDLARKVLVLTGSASTIEFHPLPQDDPVRRKPDITRARQLLGWNPLICLDEGLRMTIEWYRTRFLH